MAGRKPNTQMTRDLQTPTVAVDWVTQPNFKILGPSNILEMDQATLFKIGTWRVHENPHNLHAQCALASYKATSPINALSKYWPCL